MKSLEIENETFGEDKSTMTEAETDDRRVWALVEGGCGEEGKLEIEPSTAV